MTTNKVWAGFLAVTGFIACPCHFPITLPLLLGVLGGSGAGTFIGANSGLVYGIATAYFVVALGAGIALLNRRKVSGASCAVPQQPARQQREGHRALSARDSR